MKPSFAHCSARGLSPLPCRSLRLVAAGANGQRRNFYTINGESKRPRARKSPSVSCSQTSTWLLSTFAPDLYTAAAALPRRKSLARPRFITTAGAAQTLPEVSDISEKKPSVPRTKEELLALVTGADESSADQHFDFYRDPYRRGYVTPDTTAIQLSENRRDVEYPSDAETMKTTTQAKRIVQKLKRGINNRRRYRERIPLESIYTIYNELSEPRMLHLTGIWRDRLLNIMGLPPKRDSDSMMRYFALVADVKSAGLTLTQRQWNHALTFAATYAAKASTTEMESTMRLWREMERGANVKGNEITFNILFDVAAKAGNFALADMIFKEMVNRGLGFNRFHHVSLIFYFGLRLDSGGVRAAYREMVKAGEMVDTVALNAVISGLLRCGEEDAANETYQRMRHSQPLFNKVPRPPKDNSTEKVVSRALMMFSKLAKTYPSMRINFQAGVDISPNIRTYKLLIEHYALRIGSLKHVAQYLDEMMLAGIRPHPTIFLAIFKAFKWHGGFPGSEWSNEHLQMMLSAMFQAQKEMKDDFRIEHWIVLWALRAVKKCGSPESVEETFQSLSECWTIPEDRVPYTHSFFESILDGSDEQRAHRSRARRNLGAA